MIEWFKINFFRTKIVIFLRSVFGPCFGTLFPPQKGGSHDPKCRQNATKTHAENMCRKRWDIEPLFVEFRPPRILKYELLVEAPCVFSFFKRSPIFRSRRPTQRQNPTQNSPQNWPSCPPELHYKTNGFPMRALNHFLSRKCSENRAQTIRMVVKFTRLLSSLLKGAEMTPN